MRAHKIKHIVKAHVKRHAHVYGILAAIMSVRLIPMAFEIAALLIADVASKRLFGGGA